MPFGEYKDFKDCVSKNQDADNPEAYCAEIKKKIEGESFHVHYTIPFIRESLGTPEKPMKISGVAINEGITRNEIYYPKEELQQAARSLIGKPILKDHKEEVDAIVGRISNAFFKDGTVQFEGKIMDEKTQEMINDGRISNVSIGASVGDLTKESLDGKEYERVKDLEFLELSFVAIPGDPNAAITQALKIAEKLKRGEKMPKRVKMQEPEAPPALPAEEPEEPTEDESAKLVAEIEALEAKLAELRAALEAATATVSGLEDAAIQAETEPSAEAPAAADEEIVPPPPVPVEEAPMEAPVESLKKTLYRLQNQVKLIEARTKPKGRGLVRPNTSHKITREGNRLKMVDNKGTFVVEKTSKGTSFWRERE